MYQRWRRELETTQGSGPDGLVLLLVDLEGEVCSSKMNSRSTVTQVSELDGPIREM